MAGPHHKRFLSEIHRDGPRPAWRRCLGGCGNAFLSEGPWNRVCPSCTDRNEGIDQRHKRMPIQPLVKEDIE